MDVTKDLYRSFKLQQWPLILENSLDLFKKKINYLLRQVYEGDILGILALISNDFIEEVVNDYIHNESMLISHVCLCTLL